MLQILGSASHWASAPTREVADILVSSLTAEDVMALDESWDEIFDSPAVASTDEDACWESMVILNLCETKHALQWRRCRMPFSASIHDKLLTDDKAFMTQSLGRRSLEQGTCSAPKIWWWRWLLALFWRGFRSIASWIPHCYAVIKSWIPLPWILKVILV